MKPIKLKELLRTAKDPATQRIVIDEGLWFDAPLFEGVVKDVDEALGERIICLMQPSWLHTIDDIRHKIDGILATDKKIREHDEYYVGSLRNDIISYELVQRVE